MLPDKDIINYPAMQKSYKLNGEYLSVNKNDNLFTNTDSANCFYLVLEGSIEFVLNLDSQNTISRKVVKNEFFGFKELLGGGGKITSAVAGENSNLLRLVINDLNLPQKISQVEQIKTLQESNDLSQTTFDASLTNVSEISGIKIVHCNFRRANLTKAIDFKNFMLDLINAGHNRIIIDMSACKLIDSTFLGTLVVLMKRLSASDGKLSLVCNDDICSWLFVMTKMDNVFKISQSVDDAINAMIDQPSS